MRRLFLLVAAIVAYLNVKITLHGDYSIDINVVYCEFFMGALVADIFYDRRDEAGLLSKKYNKYIFHRATKIVSLIIGIYFVCCPADFPMIYVWMKNLPIETAIYRAAGWCLIVFYLLQTPNAQKLFERSLLQKIGHLSYAIYAFHWPIMLVLLAGLFSLLNNIVPYNVAAIASFLITLPVIYFAALLATKLDINLRGLLNKTINRKVII